MAVIFVSIASSGTYIFNGFSFSVNIIYLIIGGIVGGFIGSKFTELINTLSLQRIFSILLFIVAIRMFYNTNFEATVNENPFLYLLIGIVAGVLSGLLGIGGGIVRIPLLIIFGGLENIVAQGFSLVGTIPTAITAAIVKLRNKPDLIKQGSLIGLFGILGSVIGGNIAFTISQNILNYIFAVFLLFVGVNLFFKKT